MKNMNQSNMDERLPAAETTTPYLDKHSEITVTAGDLPHWHQDGKYQFVTFRLSDSLPQTTIAYLKQIIANFNSIHPHPWSDEVKREYWRLVGPVESKLLDNGYGSCMLKDPRIRQIAADSILYHDGRSYNLISFVIMPNHVHMIIQLLGEHTVREVMHSIKSFTAIRINKIMNRSGSVWKKEYFDRMIRNKDHLQNCLDYIRKNPEFLREGEFLLYPPR